VPINYYPAKSAQGAPGAPSKILSMNIITLAKIKELEDKTSK
jgi:hypothetical protein